MAFMNVRSITNEVELGIRNVLRDYHDLHEAIAALREYQDVVHRFAMSNRASVAVDNLIDDAVAQCEQRIAGEVEQ